jgi:hypothetical protein
MNEAAPDRTPPRLTYGITPPKVDYSEERRRATAAAQTARIAALPIDALVVYDLQDESSRTDAERPFPFLEVIDPLEYAYEDLRDVPHPKIVYRSVSDRDPDVLGDWLARLRAQGGSTVLVGAPSAQQTVRLGLGDAYRIRQARAPDLPLGGVVIAERHAQSGNEVERILRKRARGCSFFISQAVYSVTASKNLLSDLYYRCLEDDLELPPILVTLSPCGSERTLEFMSWLGVSVPRWLRNELTHARDILARSVELSLGVFAELLDFAAEKEIPLGCNVESVSLRKAEIEASVEMVHRVATMLGRNPETLPRRPVEGQSKDRPEAPPMRRR